MSSSRTRRCIASHEVLPEAQLVRFVADPDGRVVADLAAKLPGRGLWVKATREAVTRAAVKGFFARAAKANLSAAPDLADQVEAGLVTRLKSGLGLASRAGALTAGFELVRQALKAGGVGLLIEAADGAQDGRAKVFALAHAIGPDGAGTYVPVLGCLTGQQLDLALGRSNVIHAAIQSGRLAEKLAADMARLAGFRALVPLGWRLPGATEQGAEAALLQSGAA